MGIPQIPKLPSLPNPADSAAGVMCRQLEASLDSKLGELSKVRNMINGPKNALSDKLRGMVGRVATPANEMQSTLGGIQDAAGNAFPKSLGLDEVKDLLKKCGILKTELPSFSGTAILDKYKKDAGNAFKNMLKGYFSGLDLDIDFPEIGVGNMIDDLKKLLKKVDISGLLGGLDGYLNCLDSICGSNVSDKVDYANSAVTDMGLTAEGALDVDGFLSSSGIDVDQIKNIKDSVAVNDENETNLTESTESASSSLLDSLTKMKNEVLGAITPSSPFA